MRVLLAVDESPHSADAVNEVGERPWSPDTTVRVLHVVEKFVPPAQELWHDAGGSLERAKEEVAERGREIIERAARWLRERGLNAETVTRDGDPRKVIVEEAKEWGADLIVVGSHGFTGVKRLLLGSVARAVVDHAPCPVEVVYQKHAGDKTGGG
jgi:nucleotide-binding universal stress UspA family protein